MHFKAPQLILLLFLVVTVKTSGKLCHQRTALTFRHTAIFWENNTGIWISNHTTSYNCILVAEKQANIKAL